MIFLLQYELHRINFLVDYSFCITFYDSMNKGVDRNRCYVKTIQFKS